MAQRNHLSVPKGRTNYVRPLRQLSRNGDMGSVSSEKVGLAATSQTPFIPVQPQVFEPTPSHKAGALQKSSESSLSDTVPLMPKPFVRNLPKDHFVDGISATPKLAKPSASVHAQRPVPSKYSVSTQNAYSLSHDVTLQTQPETPVSRKRTSPASNYSTRKIFAKFTQIGSYGIASIVMLFFGWLAYDTLQTNQNIEQITGSGNSSQVQALAERYDESEQPGDQLKNYAVAPDLPRAVFIEKLDVRAKVLRVGVTNTNAMAVPKSIFDAGWYDGSVKPGEIGAVVINGHVSGPTKDGVFHDLKQLVAGDKISIEKGDGTKLTYQVNRVAEVAVKDVDMTELMVAKPGKKSLHLITCGGVFDEEASQFQSRVLVFADQI